MQEIPEIFIRNQSRRLFFQRQVPEPEALLRKDPAEPGLPACLFLRLKPEGLEQEHHLRTALFQQRRLRKQPVQVLPLRPLQGCLFLRSLCHHGHVEGLAALPLQMLVPVVQVPHRVAEAGQLRLRHVVPRQVEIVVDLVPEPQPVIAADLMDQVHPVF